jgi:hypothetical protein
LNQWTSELRQSSDRPSRSPQDIEAGRKTRREPPASRIAWTGHDIDHDSGPDGGRAARTPPALDPTRRVDLRRLKSPVAAAALAASAVGAVGMTFGTVVAGRLAENPSRGLVWLLALSLVGAAVVDTAGKIAWVGRSDRAEGRLREDLLRASPRPTGSSSWSTARWPPLAHGRSSATPGVT